MPGHKIPDDKKVVVKSLVEAGMIIRGFISFRKSLLRFPHVIT